MNHYLIEFSQHDSSICNVFNDIVLAALSSWPRVAGAIKELATDDLLQSQALLTSTGNDDWHSGTGKSFSVCLLQFASDDSTSDYTVVEQNCELRMSYSDVLRITVVALDGASFVDAGTAIVQANVSSGGWQTRSPLVHRFIVDCDQPSTVASQLYFPSTRDQPSRGALYLGVSFCNVSDGISVDLAQSSVRRQAVPARPTVTRPAASNLSRKREKALALRRKKKQSRNQSTLKINSRTNVNAPPAAADFRVFVDSPCLTLPSWSREQQKELADTIRQRAVATVTVEASGINVAPEAEREPLATDRDGGPPVEVEAANRPTAKPKVDNWLRPFSIISMNNEMGGNGTFISFPSAGAGQYLLVLQLDPDKHGPYSFSRVKMQFVGRLTVNQDDSIDEVGKENDDTVIHPAASIAVSSQQPGVLPLTVSSTDWWNLKQQLKEQRSQSKNGAGPKNSAVSMNVFHYLLPHLRSFQERIDLGRLRARQRESEISAGKAGDVIARRANQFVARPFEQAAGGTSSRSTCNMCSMAWGIHEWYCPFNAQNQSGFLPHQPPPANSYRASGNDLCSECGRVGGVHRWHCPRGRYSARSVLLDNRLNPPPAPGSSSGQTSSPLYLPRTVELVESQPAVYMLDQPLTRTGLLTMLRSILGEDVVDSVVTDWRRQCGESASSDNGFGHSGNYDEDDGYDEGDDLESREIVFHRGAAHSSHSSILHTLAQISRLFGAVIREASLNPGEHNEPTEQQRDDALVDLFLSD